MIEFPSPSIDHFRHDELDKEDILLREAMAELQAIVTGFLQKAGRSINDLTQDEQQALVDQIDPHLKFELHVSKDICKGLPIVMEGAGAFLLTDAEGALLGAQVTAEGDVLTGTVTDVQAYPVPSSEIVRAADPNEPLPTFDQSLSAVMVIEGASFHSSPTPDGAFQISHDLSAFRAIVPVVYGMAARVADIA